MSKLAQTLAIVLLTALLAPAMAFAQDDDEFVPDDSAQPAGGENAGSDLTSDLDFGAVDDLLAAEEEVLSAPDTYTYDPGARRDPFRSLLRRRDQNNDEVREERPEGKPGLLIDEIELQKGLGKAAMDAILLSGASRLRPVAMAVTIIGGLVVATVLTMVFVPVLYAIFFRVDAQESS